MVSGKIELLLSLKNKLSTGLSEAKKKLDTGITDMKGSMNKLKSSHIKAFSAMKEQIPGLGGAMSMLANPYVAAAAAAAALGATLVKATGMAMKYEQGMAKINTTAQLSKEELKGLKNQLMDIGKNSGGNFDRIPESFEKIISQVGDVDTSLEILKAATTGAKAGFTDLDTVSAAVAQSLSVIGKENTNAQEVLDTFFAAKRVGAGEFKDFAQYLPTLIAAGKNLGMNFKDVAGTFAYMTAKGQDAASATTLIQNAFSALSKGDVIKGLSGAGIQLFDKEGTMRDFSVIMTELSNKMNGMSDKQKTNFLESVGLRDVQAKNAISILTSDTELLKQTFNDTRNSVGEMNTALEGSKNLTTTWGDVTDKISFMMTKLGDLILPIVSKAVEFINDTLGSAIDYFKNLYDKSELFRDIIKFIGKIIYMNTVLPLKLAWESIKAVGDAIQWIYEKLGGKGNLWENLFGGIEKWYRIIKNVFAQIVNIGTAAWDVITSGFSKSSRDAFSSALDSFSIDGAISKVNKELETERMKGLSGAYKTIANSREFSPFSKKESELSNYITPLTPKKDDNTTKKTEDDKSTNQVNKVTGASSQTRNLSIRIDALHKGDINVSSENISKLSPQELEKWFQNLVLRSIRNVEAAY